MKIIFTLKYFYSRYLASNITDSNGYKEYTTTVILALGLLRLPATLPKFGFWLTTIANYFIILTTLFTLNNLLLKICEVKGLFKI